MEEKFIEYMKEKGLSENTYSSYARDVKLFNDYYHDSYGEPLKKLIHADVRMYANYLYKNGISAKSINRKIASLKQYNMFLVEEKIQDNIAIIDKDYIKIQPTLAKKEVLSLQDINKLKHHSANDSKNPERDYCFISVYVNGGLRESEIIEIRLADVLLEQRFLNVVGKGNKFRQVIINNEMYDAIIDYLKVRKEMKTDNPYLFIGNKNKNTTEPLSRNFGNRLLDKYKEICNIGKLHPHLLRLYFCNNALYNAGYSIVQVANQAGHYSLNTTRGYITNEQEDLFKLANKL